MATEEKLDNLEELEGDLEEVLDDEAGLQTANAKSIEEEVPEVVEVEEKRSEEVSRPGSRKAPKKKLLKPINEEDTDRKWVSNKAYTAIFERIHADLKYMKIGPKRKADFFEAPKKFALLLQQIADIKSGKYDHMMQ